MIPRVSLNLDKNYSSFQNRVQKNKTTQSMSNPVAPEYEKSFSGGGQTYYVPFTAAKANMKSGVGTKSKYNELVYRLDTPARQYLNDVAEDALESGYSKVTTLHVIRRGLQDLDKFIDAVNADEIDANDPLKPAAAIMLEETISPSIIKDEEMRNQLQPAIKEQIQKLDEVLEKLKPQRKPEKLNSQLMSDDLIDSLILNVEKDGSPIEIDDLFNSALAATDAGTSKFVNTMDYDLDKAVMWKKIPLEKRIPFSAYKDRAVNVLKNLELGNNIFLTYDSKIEDPQNFIDTVKAIHDKTYGDKSEFIELNGATSQDYFTHLVTELGKDKNKDYIVVLDPSILMATVNANGTQVMAMYPETQKALQKQPKNVKYMFHDTKNTYYALNSPEAFQKMFKTFDEAPVPTLNTEQKIQAFKENPSLMKDIKNSFTRGAVDKVLEASIQMDGVFPDKTVNLMQKISRYYIDKKEVNEKDVAKYLFEAKSMLKKSGDEAAFEVIFDTNKRLKDLTGKEATRKEAAAIVKQIKSNQMGTKGVVIYSQDGSPGSGRRFTAKAIAGEAKIPYMEINTMDFGTKDVDILGGGALSPEASMKKLFSIVRSQAESAPNKSAVLFVENFEYFSVGEMVSLYHQKAMAQLLREMDKANKDGLNILVVGSVADPRLIGEATMKSFKFVDSIEVSSPAYNKDERADIIAQTLKKNGFRLSGTLEEKQDTIKFVSEISEGFPFIQLKNLVNKAQSVAIERGHKQIVKGDFTEAYLQLTTGRPSTGRIEPHEKNVVTSHECGHATNLEVMNNIAKTLGKPWHIPDKVNFITLDPRGFYGGAVYHGEDINSQYSFEKFFSNLVCSYGGNSAEHRFYGMNGSLGISCDMQSARNVAEYMVKVAGMGAKTGKMAIDDGEILSDKLQQMVEDDERVILNNASIVSDLITEEYSEFNKWFTEKYSPLVGTGDCLVDGDEFRHALKEWRAAQSPEVQEELALCDDTILKVIEATKKGIAVRKEN